ncbi:9451_t:CDS:2 [Ambispora leptoticha]|uniref:9451_t:CDS:1 n=1 Tax=Ambispora leptoticha TaxID=144679 RepID=A0A9N9A2W7_9GLOM|nr:9451_t:CDS:2 [Ambispora leptoticha]
MGHIRLQSSSNQSLKLTMNRYQLKQFYEFNSICETLILTNSDFSPSDNQKILKENAINLNPGRDNNATKIYVIPNIRNDNQVYGKEINNSHK